MKLRSNVLQGSILLFLILFSAPVLALECFEESPNQQKYGRVDAVQRFKPLSAQQHKEIKSVLQAAKGNWRGTMEIKECRGSRNTPRVSSDTTEVEGRAEFDGKQYTFEFESTSKKTRSTKTETFEYQLSKDNFSMGKSTQLDTAQIVDTGPVGITFYRRVHHNPVRSSALVTKEFAYVIKAPGGKLEIKEFLYVNGEFSTQRILRLR